MAVVIDIFLFSVYLVCDYIPSNVAATATCSRCASTWAAAPGRPRTRRACCWPPTRATRARCTSTAACPPPPRCSPPSTGQYCAASVGAASTRRGYLIHVLLAAQDIQKLEEAVPSDGGAEIQVRGVFTDQTICQHA